MTDILIPVCSRPEKVPALVASIRATTPLARILFITDEDDDGREQDAISQADCEWVSSSECVTYAQKINLGVRRTDGERLCFAADDLLFRPGWLHRAMLGSKGVVGLNDGIPRPDRPSHATHFVVARWYAEMPAADGARGPLCERYRHWYTDDEFVATARCRDSYRYAEYARIEHRHPSVGTARMDPTYRVGYDWAEPDRALFESRRHLWER